MELIFPRSTLARLTPRGVVGALRPAVEVGVTGVAVAGVVALAFEDLVGVVGSVSFDNAPSFVVLETTVEAFSFFSSDSGKKL